MDSEFCTGQTNKSHDSSPESLQHLDDIGDVEASKAKVEPSLSPITPDANKENGDFPGSPLTMVKQLPKIFSFDSKSKRNEDPFTEVYDSSSPQTPKDSIFDPFAPCSEDKVLAPQYKKYLNEARVIVARRLNFGSFFKGLGSTSCGNDAGSFSDEEMFKSVYENLLEVIIYEQTESAFAEISNIEWDSDACRTPPSAPLLSGVAETCPGAPLKPAGKSRIIDLGLCRKLEF